MRKKIAAVICAAVMCAGTMVSCGENSTSESSVKESTQTTVTQSEETEESAADDRADVTDSEVTGEESGITPAMWEVKGPNGATVTFMGSMHALSEEDYPLPDEIMGTLKSCDILAVEADLSNTASITYQSALLANMYYDNKDDSLDKHVSAEAYDALKEYLATYPLSMDTVRILKPWAACNTADTIALQYSELRSDLGIDSYLLEQAKEMNKEIYEVEGTEFQMDLLMEQTDETYDALLKQYKDKTKEMMLDQLYTTHEAWEKGDMDTIDELNNETADVGEEEGKLLEAYTTAFLDDRNKGMEKAAKDFIEGDKNVFFVVGAAHFAGENGVISLLEKDGYTVERKVFG